MFDNLGEWSKERVLTELGNPESWSAYGDIDHFEYSTGRFLNFGPNYHILIKGDKVYSVQLHD